MRNKYEIVIAEKMKGDKEYFMSEGYYLSEQLDEFECNLREIVGNIIAEYLWRHFHLSESDDRYCDIIDKIIKSHIDLDIYVADKDENDEYDENTKILMKL